MKGSKLKNFTRLPVTHPKNQSIENILCVSAPLHEIGLVEVHSAEMIKLHKQTITFFYEMTQLRDNHKILSQF